MLDEKALEEYTKEDFKLEIYKTSGMNNPGLKYKGSQRALLSFWKYPSFQFLSRRQTPRSSILLDLV